MSFLVTTTFGFDIVCYGTQRRLSSLVCWFYRTGTWGRQRGGDAEDRSGVGNPKGDIKIQSGTNACVVKNPETVEGLRGV